MSAVQVVFAWEIGQRLRMMRRRSESSRVVVNRNSRISQTCLASDRGISMFSSLQGGV